MTKRIYYRNIIISILIVAFLIGIYFYVDKKGGIKSVWRQISAFPYREGELEYSTAPITLGGVALNALIADTEEKHMVGLSGRRTLSGRQAMLFIFEKPDRYGIWMRDMLFPIDIIWVDSNLRVVSLISNATPLSFPTVFEPTSPALYVIETKAGFIEKNQIATGTSLIIFK